MCLFVTEYRMIDRLDFYQNFGVVHHFHVNLGYCTDHTTGNTEISLISQAVILGFQVLHGNPSTPAGK